MSGRRRVLETVIIVPVFGRHDLTDQLIEDLGPDACNLIVVDNGGDFYPKGEILEVVSPGVNLGWASGCNFGLEVARQYHARHYLILNNDIRISIDFVAGLVKAADSGAAIVGPLYDHNWPHQRGNHDGAAVDYVPRAVERRVPFVDGTAMLIGAEWLGQGLDAATWPHFGWGCDKDLCMRVRSAGGVVVVSERSFLNHIGRGTAALDPHFLEEAAEAENDEGMLGKYGEGWKGRLYAGFPELNRRGDTQDRLARLPAIDLADSQRDAGHFRDG